MTSLARILLRHHSCEVSKKTDEGSAVKCPIALSTAQADYAVDYQQMGVHLVYLDVPRLQENIFLYL